MKMLDTLYFRGFCEVSRVCHIHPCQLMPDYRPSLTKSVIVYIGGGEYNEKITILQNKLFVIFYGSPTNMPTLTFVGTAQKYGTVNSATVIVESDYFVAANLIIKNSSSKPNGKRVGEQALALRVSGNKLALFNYRLIGFQDKLCDDRGNHFFKDFFIEDTVDFIFGSGKSLCLVMPPNL
ncbi:hypothetical protein PRUPE_2G268400 [Prunus persica]|uniref:pectinesterase n=1 Tax=Prunus persica TaxID=3760 RepID=M5X4W6_PRUPE|nr:hypothetical protein PRUPE_2G268400 [Prunus persica]